jgi:hypothetical protein
MVKSSAAAGMAASSAKPQAANADFSSCMRFLRPARSLPNLGGSSSPQPGFFVSKDGPISVALQHGPANGTVGGHLAATGIDGRNARQAKRSSVVERRGTTERPLGIQSALRRVIDLGSAGDDSGARHIGTKIQPHGFTAC